MNQPRNKQGTFGTKYTADEIKPIVYHVKGKSRRQIIGWIMYQLDVSYPTAVEYYNLSKPPLDTR